MKQINSAAMKTLFDDEDFYEFPYFPEFEPFEEPVLKEEEKPRRLTDEEYIRKIRTRMRRFASFCVSTNQPLGAEDLKSVARREIRKYCEDYYGLYIDETEAGPRLSEGEEIERRLKMAISEMAEETLFMAQKKRAVYTMNKSMAEAAVSKLLEDSGYDFYIHYTLSYAKVHIKLTKKKKAVLYLKFNRLEQQLPKIAETLETYRNVYETFGAGSGVISLYKHDDDNFDWARQDREGMKNKD